MEILGIIPARYASTRFPGKPLVNIAGKTMIQRVYEQARRANLSKVVVATDDERILAEVKRFGGEALLTAAHHQSGTDRCFEAYTRYDVPHDFIVNIQGDEPFIQPEQINLLISCFNNPATQLATLVKPIDTPDELFNPHSPKVVMNQHREALYFSRQPIPYLRGADEITWPAQHTYYKHIGIYGYRADILEQITQLPPSPLEKAESLEQLRWLENGYKIAVAITHLETFGIDTPADLEKALQANSRQE